MTAPHTPAGPGREREETLPGSRPAAGPRLSATELSQTRKLVWLTSAVAFAFALVAIVLFQLLIHALRGSVYAQAGDARAACVEGAVPDGCPEGQVCQSGRCVHDDYAASTLCEAGDACGRPGDCDCAAPLQCREGRCDAPDPAEDVCRERAVLTALENLRAKCAGDIDVCPKSDLKKYAIENPEFDRLMSEFPGTVTLHFPAGKPPLGRRDAPWPDPATRSHYLARLAPALPALARARHVFIISRSSPQGDPRRNDAYAQQRSTLTKALILDALRAGGTADVLAVDAMRGKFADFLLGPQKQIGAGLFRERYANRAITWSEASQRMLRSLVARDEVPVEDERWRTNVINQVVFVVPVPCELGVGGQG